MLRPVYEVMRSISLGADARSVLEAVAHGVSDAVGFEVAAISQLTGDSHLEIVAVAGSSEAHDALIGTRTTLTELEEELSLADQWGSLLFIPAERLDPTAPTGWIPTLTGTVTTGPDRWRPEDTLRCPLRSPEGELLGILAVDLPVDGLRPDRARRELLEMYGDLAGIALHNARRSSELQMQVRLTTTVQAINSTPTRSFRVADIVDAQVAPVAAALGSDTLWLRALGERGTDTRGHGARFPASEGDLTPMDAIEAAARHACRTWDEGTVTLMWLGDDGEIGTSERATQAEPREGGVLAFVPSGERIPVARGAAGWVKRQFQGQQPVTTESQPMVDFVRQFGAAHLLLVPLGAGPDCLGYLVAVRRPGRPPWSSVEVAAAAQVARNLGQSVLNARLLEHEQQLLGQLKALAHYKDDLISTVSHELRTPLTSIAGHLELIEDAAGEAPAASIAVMHRNLERVMSLIDNLLTFKKVADPSTPARAGVVDLQEIAISAVATFKPSAEDRGVLLHVLPSSGPVHISGDHDELERVALNLVSNAVKYTPAGGKIIVSAELAERFARLVCADTGIGISKADQEELFTEFFRSTNPDALTEPGTGLGLSIVRGIVQRHGGSIRLESDLGEGSTFTVRLPLSRASP